MNTDKPYRIALFGSALGLGNFSFLFPFHGDEQCVWTGHNCVQVRACVSLDARAYRLFIDYIHYNVI